MKIYIAGSFSNAEEKGELLKLIEHVREKHPDDEVWVPMEHFVTGGNDKDENGNYIMPNDVWGRKVYEMDREALVSCDEMIALYRGRISGTGTAWEIGYLCGINEVLGRSGLPKKKITVYVANKADIASVMIINGVDNVIAPKTIEQK